MNHLSSLIYGKINELERFRQNEAIPFSIAHQQFRQDLIPLRISYGEFVPNRTGNECLDRR